MRRRPPSSTLFPYTARCRSRHPCTGINHKAGSRRGDQRHLDRLWAVGQVVISDRYREGRRTADKGDRVRRGGGTSLGLDGQVNIPIQAGIAGSQGEYRIGSRNITALNHRCATDREDCVLLNWLL